MIYKKIGLFYIFQEMPNANNKVNMYFCKLYTNWYSIISWYKYVIDIFLFFPIHIL